MGRPRKNPDETRHNRHREDTLRIPLNADRKTKAILLYTASLLGMTITDLLISKGMKVAKDHGIIDENGNVTSEHRAGFELSMDIIKNQKGA